MKKKTTIEDLASMTQRGFTETHEKVDKGFKEVKDWQKLADGRFDAIEMELTDIRKKLDHIVYRHEFETLRDRVENLEARLAAAKKR